MHDLPVAKFMSKTALVKYGSGTIPEKLQIFRINKNPGVSAGEGLSSGALWGTGISQPLWIYNSL
jgi:hypothetical protein